MVVFVLNPSSFLSFAAILYKAGGRGVARQSHSLGTNGGRRGVGSETVSQSQLLKCWLKSKRKEVASALTVNQAEASSVLDIVKAIAVGDVFIEEHE